VGQLVKMGTEKGRKTRPSLHVGHLRRAWGAIRRASSLPPVGWIMFMFGYTAADRKVGPAAQAALEEKQGSAAAGYR